MANLEKIFYIRKKKLKISCEVVGKELGMTAQTYRKREDGDIEFTISEAKKLCIILEADKEELFPEIFL